MTDKDMPAFPSVPTDAAGSPADWREGLTKREYFAGEALKGLLANHLVMQATSETVQNKLPGDRYEKAAEIIANMAFTYADALIRRSNQP